MLTYEHVILDFRSSAGSFCFYQIYVIHASVLSCSKKKMHLFYMDQIWTTDFVTVYCPIVTILKILDIKNMSSVTKAKMLNLVNCDVKNIKPVIYLAKFVIWRYFKTQNEEYNFLYIYSLTQLRGLLTKYKMIDWRTNLQNSIFLSLCHKNSF